MDFIKHILIIMFVGQGFAQQTFYFRPKIENKIHQNLSEYPQINSFFNNNYNTSYVPIPYGTVKAPVFFTTKSFTLGLNIGVKFNNSDLLEFGWNADQSGSKIVHSNLGFNPDYPDVYFPQNGTKFGINLANQRFELLYYKRRKTDRDENLLNLPNSYFVFGMGFKYMSNTVSPTNPHNGQTFTSGGGSYDNIEMFWEHKVFGWNKYSGFCSFGFSSDLNFNTTYLFSWSLLYTVGFNILQSTQDKLDVYENDILVKTYNYETYSRGSGFQLQISRKLQVHPWKKWKKD
jgi:hypothetical protein